MTTNEKLVSLRRLMKENNIIAYYVNTADPHQSEYIAEHYQTRSWLTGFTGSAGYALVTQEEALLWVDGRYFIQAEKEISGTEFKMMKIGNSDYPTIEQWLIRNLNSNDILAMNGELISESFYLKLERLLKPYGILIKTDYQLVEEIWKNRPEKPNAILFTHELQYTGKTAAEKVNLIREKMIQDKAEAALYAGLNDICWLFNIRGGDIANNPVAISYALITLDKAILYIVQNKVVKQVYEHLLENNITIKEYDIVFSDVANLNVSILVLNKEKINHNLFNKIPQSIKIINKQDYPYLIKACLNDVELKNQRNSYIKDSVALTKFIYYIKQNVDSGILNELNVADTLHDLRKEQDLFLDESFSTIAAYGANGAMMHYSATPESYSKIKAESFLLIDSGGHYLDGTTDITRTISCGELTEEQRTDYTLVLKAHLNLARAIFLSGATGYYLDVLARQPLWQYHMDYKSGTGHGVGYLLGVHEGPQRFNMQYANVPLHEGMVITNEPGVYKENKYGIRLENDYVVVKDKKVDADQFMKLDCLSFVPFDRDAIDISLLEKYELDWLNNYQQAVYAKISPFLNEQEKAWLKEETATL
ncbi:MAG: aminopeptidase P family protein [Clostridiaceae bacterium]|nr:aminopeptidase P family protein [Clostridiaceae bacterium]